MPTDYPKNWNEMEIAKDHFLSFMIVRDPLERLASCYKDKMVTNSHWSLVGFRRHVKKKAADMKKMKGINITNGPNDASDSDEINVQSNLPSRFWSGDSSLSDEEGNSAKDKHTETSRLASSAIKSPKNISRPPSPEE